MIVVFVGKDSVIILAEEEAEETRRPVKVSIYACSAAGSVLAFTWNMEGSERESERGGKD